MTHLYLEPQDRLQKSTEQHIKEVNTVATAYASVRANEITYVSTPITSGRALYTAVKNSGLTLQQFVSDKKRMGEEVISQNIQNAEAVALLLLETSTGAIISPATFEARAIGWTQDEYMAMWLRVINDRVTKIAMLDGWGYSNGACEEYTEAIIMTAGLRLRKNVTPIHQDGTPLTITEGFAELTDVAYDLQKYDTNAPRIAAECLAKMFAVERPLQELHGTSYIFDKGDRIKAAAFLDERIDLLLQLDPMFVEKNSITGKFWQQRQEHPLEAHLFRRREEFESENITFQERQN